MQLNFKNNFIGYFRFYYGVLGNKIILNLFLCVLVSFLDGIGLAMFMPLLQAVGEGGAGGEDASMGSLKFITDGIRAMGFELNLNTVLVFLVLMFMFKGAVKFIQSHYQVKLRHIFMKKVRNSLVDDLQALSYKGFLKLDAGKIQNTLIAESQRLFLTMNHYFNAAQSGIMLITYVILAILANYQFAIMVAIGAVISNFLYRRIYIATKRASVALSKRGHDFNGFLIQAIHYFKYLKSTDYFSKFSVKLKDVIHQSELLNRKMEVYRAITLSTREPIIICIVALVIYLQVTLMGGSLTSIILSLLLYYRALSYLMLVQNSWQNFIQNIGAMETVSQLSREMREMKEEHGETSYNGLKEHIRFENVEFSYHTNKVLNGINLTIPRNKTIALVGESGSGKTTLANMIVGLIKPDNGKVYIDNVELNDVNLESFRNKIGYISQEAVIFNDDIFNNITFWAERTPENYKKFWETVKLASLTEFVQAQPEKENTKLGDNGIMISGGQKQRISIARELFKDAEIMVLDEATSALDSETEKVIQENIEGLHGKYTMVIIAHRLSTIKNADRIYLLEKGRVESSGNFETMLKESPRFQRMVSLQEF